MANQVVPLYLSEMAPFKYRGGLNMMFQLAVTIGGHGVALHSPAGVALRPTMPRRLVVLRDTEVGGASPFPAGSLAAQRPGIRCPAFFPAAGILVAQLINYGVQDWSHGWRLSLGLAAVPAFILLLGGIMLPESPNSLIER